MAGPLDFILGLFGGGGGAPAGGVGDYGAEMESPAAPGELPWQNQQTGAPIYAPPQDPARSSMQPGARQQQAGGQPWPPRAAAESGTIMGFIDHLMGVPTRQQVGLMADERNRKMEEARTSASNKGLATIVGKLQDINEKNPQLPPQQRFQMLIQSPEFKQNLMENGHEDMMDVVKKIFEGLEIDPAKAAAKFPILKPGDVMIDPGTIDPATNKPKEIFREPKLPDGQTRGTVKPSELLTGGDPRLTELGIKGVKPGERVEVQTQRLVDGTTAVIGYQFPDKSPMDMKSWAAIQESKPLIKRSFDIRDQQAATLSAARVAENIFRVLENPKGGGALNLGPAAIAVRVGEGLVAQAQALARETQFSLDPTQYSSAINNIVKSGRLQVRAGEATAVQSNLTALAYMIAKANNQGPVTKADVEDAFKEIGSSMGSPTQTKAGLTQMLQRAIDKQDQQLEVYRSAFESAAAQGIPVSVPERMETMLAKQGLTRFRGSVKPTGSTVQEQTPTETPKPAKGSPFSDGKGGTIYYDGVGDPMDPKSYSKTPVK